MLGAIGAVPRDRPSARSPRTRSTRTRPPPLPVPSPTIPRSRRCSHLATPGSRPFWLNPQDALAAGGPFRGLLRHRGGRRRPVHDDARPPAASPRARGADRPLERGHRRADRRRRTRRLGPGTRRSPRSRRRRGCAGCARSSPAVGHSGRPLLAVCLSHQILAAHVRHRSGAAESPHQGLQKTVDVFGMPASIGFYNTFTARVPAGHDVGRRGRGGRRPGHRRRLRPARPGVRLGAGTPRVDPLARRDDDARAARRRPRSPRRRLTQSAPARGSTARTARRRGSTAQRPNAEAAASRRRSASFAVSSSAHRSSVIASSSRPRPAQHPRTDGVPEVIAVEFSLQGVHLVQRRPRAVDLGDGDRAVQPHDGRAVVRAASMS